MRYTDHYSLKKPQPAEQALVQNLNDNADAIDLLIYQDRRMTAKAYDSQRVEPYVVGERCIYENRYYKCVTPTSGNWDSSAWDETNVGDDILEAMQSGGTEVIPNPTGTAVGTLTSLEIDGDKYEIQGGGGGGSSTLAGLDDVSLTTPTQGQALVYDGTDWINGDAVGGSGSYIDTDNVIQSQTSIPANTDVTYTATQDCWVVFALISASNNSAKAEIDGVKIHEQFSSSQVMQYSSNCILKKGQTILLRQSYTGGSGNYVVYGVTYTSSNLQPVIYSTEEREIGVYTDGKPLYQKTIYHNTPITGTGINAIWQDANADTIVWYEGIFGDGNNLEYGIPYYFNSNEWCRFIIDTQQVWVTGKGICFQKGNNQAVNYVKLTVQYTKTTDTPGSGTWTPSGVPAVHYSTDEQVVGTWVDMSTLYKRVFTGLSTQTNGASWVHISQISTTDWNEIIDVAIYRIANNKYVRMPLAEFNGSVGGVKDLAVSIVSSSFNSTIAMAVVSYTKSSS